MQWNSQLEKVISDEGEKCLSFSWLHSRSEKKYSALDVWINIPVIILSTLAGAASIGSEGLFAGFEKASVIIGIISILVGILNTLGQYFGWGKRSENHRICSIQYSKIYNYLKIELALPRADRTGADDFLKIIKNELERLKEISPAIPDSVIKEYKINFANYTDVSKPDICNGLANIEVYSPKVEEEVNYRLSCNLTPLIAPPPTPQNEEVKEEPKPEEKPKPRVWK